MEARPNNFSFFKNCLQKRVGSTDCFNDLISILRVIPLSHIKHFISQQIEELDLNLFAIGDIFPADIIQYILSFGGLYHTKAVSKTWKQYSEQNERKHLTKLYSSIKEIKSPVQYDENLNKTYIIDQHRTKLHGMEIERGYVGPMAMVDIEETLKICNSGDRLLFHSGVYDVSNVYCVKLNIQLIGVGSAVTFDFSNDDDDWDPVLLFDNGIKCDIRNIKFDGERQLDLNALTNSTLQLDNCEFSRGQSAAIYVEHGAYLNVNNCRLIDIGYCRSNTAIELSPFAKEVNIIDCAFENCGINIKRDIDRRVPVDQEIMQLKCVGNIFDVSNSLDQYHPITADESANYVAQSESDRYTLRDNLLKGASVNYEGNPNKIKLLRNPTN